MNSSKLCDGGAVIIFSSPRCMMAFYVDSLGRRPVSRRALNEYNVDAAFELVKYANMGKQVVGDQLPRCCCQLSH